MKVRERAKKPDDLALRLAQKKALYLAQQHPGPWSLAVTKWGSATTAC